MTALSSARVWAAAAAAAAAAVGASLLAVPGAASADPLPAGCTQADTTGPVTCVYTSGSNELFLPEGVSSVTVTVVGGRGADFTYADGGVFFQRAGGRAAEVTGTVAVPSGTRSLFAVVGGNGGSTVSGPGQAGGAGGANGGGTGGTPTDNYWEYSSPGAGGGGASDIRTAAGDLATRLVVAAGGGGAAIYAPGGNAGAPGQTPDDFQVAQAGTGTAGGRGGSRFDGGPAWSGADGVLGAGGAGGPVQTAPANANGGGGGGGGGLYGGGGGASAGSGAGGSSLAPAGTTLALSDAAPSVTITYQPPTVTPPVCTGSACLPAGLFGSS